MAIMTHAKFHFNRLMLILILVSGPLTGTKKWQGECQIKFQDWHHFLCSACLQSIGTICISVGCYQNQISTNFKVNYKSQGFLSLSLHTPHQRLQEAFT